MSKTKLIILTFVGICALASASAYWIGYNLGTAAGGSELPSALTGSAGAKRGASQKGGLAVTHGAPGVILESLLKGPARPDADLLARWAKGLSPAEKTAAIHDLQALPAGQQRDAILGAVVNAWAAADPKDYLASADGIANLRLREGGVTAALQAWAAQDPKAALEWALQNAGPGSNNSSERRYAAAIAGYAAVDPQGAFDVVTALDESSTAGRAMKRQSYDAISNTLADQGKYADGIALFEKLPAGQVRDSSLAHLVDRWGTAAPVEASGWIATQPISAMRNNMSENLSDTWSTSDPAAGAAWAVQIEQYLASTPPANGQTTNYPGSDPGDILSQAINNWSRYDMNAAGTFLNQLPASAAKDRVVSQFVSRVSQQDPASGFAWALTIADDRQRQKAMQQAANQWQQQDPAAFGQFLSSTSALPADQKQALFNTAQNQAQRNQGGGNNNGQGNNSGG